MNRVILYVTKSEQDAIHDFCKSKGIKVGDFCFQAVKDTMKRIGGNIREVKQ